ncbi:MAG: hypothetical protein AB7G17_03615 [Phycisphaerales bacterium]
MFGRKKMNRRSARLSGWTHDLWFDADALRAQIGQDRLVIVLWRTFSRGEKEETCELEIRGVRSMEVRDTEEVGWYDVDWIEVDDGNTEAVIHGNVPITVVIRGELEFGLRRVV